MRNGQKQDNFAEWCLKSKFGATTSGVTAKIFIECFERESWASAT